MVESGEYTMLSGEYRHSIDTKGRMIIPSKFREELGNNFIVTKGLEGCLFVYSITNFEKIVERLRKLPFMKQEVRMFMRLFLAGARELEFDKQGRINIPNSLLEYAKIKKECVIIGVLDRLEIWNEELYQKTVDDNYESFGDIAESIIEGGFDDVA